MAAIYLDLETRSRVDLRACGADKYSRHSSTEVLCLCYGADPENLKTWLPGDPVPDEFLDPANIFFACNADFETALFEHVLTPDHHFPLIPDSRWFCTAAASAYAGLPQSLDKVSKRLDLGEFGKDKSGHTNMLRLCKPLLAEPVDGILQGGHYDNDPDRHAKNVAYCLQDVVAEVVGHSMLPEFPERERRIWLMHRRINARGVPVDLDLCRGAVAIINATAERYTDELLALTGGLVETADQIDRVKDFVNGLGAGLPNLQEQTIIDYLPSVKSPTARRVLEIRQLLTSSAVKKYQATICMATPDERCRNAFVYYGAGPGRWTGRGVQFQNLKRPSRKPGAIAAAIPAIVRGDAAEVSRLSNGDPLSILADATRSIIRAPKGRKLIVADFKSIEARVLHWLVGDEPTLEKFRCGADLYVDLACRIYQCTAADIVDPATGDPRNPAMKERRQVGKCAVLGLGYQMGATKFVGSAKDVGGVTIEPSFADQVVDIYRSANPKVVEFWREIKSAAEWCVRKRREVSIPRVRFRMHGQWLVMRIPSGRELFYFQPEFVQGDRYQELVYMSPRGQKKLYGGLLTENLDQATSRDLLADAMLRIESMGMDIVLHCHDEVVPEVDADDDGALGLVEWAMTQVEPWAEGIPVGVDIHDCERYTK